MKKINLSAEIIESKGKRLGMGKDRTVYQYKDRVYKIADGTDSEFVNKEEFKLYSSYKNQSPVIYNPVVAVSEDFEIIEVEKCLSFLEFLVKKAGVPPLDIIKKQEEEGYGDDDMVDLIKLYKLERFLPASWAEIHNFLFNVNNHDWCEAQFYSNWGYNIKRKHLVILDYAE